MTPDGTHPKVDGLSGKKADTLPFPMSARTATNRLPAAERRRQLLAVALQEFGGRGYHQTSMSTLAEAAGVTKPVLYQHFISKREMYLEVLRDIADRLQHSLSAALADATSAHEQVEAGFGAYFSFFADEPRSFEVLFGDSSRRDDIFAQEAHRAEAAIAENVKALITTDGLTDDDRRVLAFGIVGLAEGASRYWMARGFDLDPKTLANQVADLVWFGLRGRPRS